MYRKSTKKRKKQVVRGKGVKTKVNYNGRLKSTQYRIMDKNVKENIDEDSPCQTLLYCICISFEDNFSRMFAQIKN